MPVFNDAHIGYHNYLDGHPSWISAVNTSSGFFPESLANWMPWDYWQGNAGSGHIQIDAGSARLVDYAALAGHNIFTAGATLVVACSNDPTFATGVTELATVSLGSSGGLPAYNGSFTYGGSVSFSDTSVVGDPVVFFKLSAVNFRYYRVSYTGATKPVRIGVLSIGRRMFFEIGFYGGFTPPKWNDDEEVTNTRSEGGLFLGRSVLRTGIKGFSIDLDPVTHTWIDTVWLPFKQHASVKPFFLAWGDVPTENNLFALQGSWRGGKLKNRKHASVGVTLEGVTR